MAAAEDAIDLDSLTALVVDASEFHRSIATDILRTQGVRFVVGARSAEEGLDSIRMHRPGLVLLDWMEGPLGGLEFIRQVRTGEDIPNRAVPILMLSARRKQREVEAAREAGADAYLMKPVSAGAIAAKLGAVVMKPRAFISSPNYVGPCRRRRADPAYGGPRRRLTDTFERREDPISDEDDVKGALKRARVAALTQHALGLQPDDPDAARIVYASSLELRSLADEIEDKMLSFGAGQLVRYMEAVGATERLDPEAVRTHVQALHQLAHLPNALADERRDVATSLRNMIDKKLRQADAA
ncbi:MAG: response regulator [Hyphomonadaceae bacterium]